MAPENTIAACRLALENGASALEVDVRLCASGEAILFHDNFLWHHFRVPKAVIYTSWDEINKLEFNGRVYQYKDRVCTLDKFLNTFKNTVPLNLDVKNFMTNNKKLVHVLVEQIRLHGVEDQVWISSFSPIFLRTLKKEYPFIRTGYLFRNFSFIHRYIDVFLKSDAWHPHYHLVTKRFLELSKRLKKEVYVWTIKEEILFKEMMRYQFNGIITDVLIK
ncbi:MAG: glycerophosphodiester phosphodiesterase [Calditrichaeota bacterium]|nr:glycerophosphodiester phosphodiesterase [Calditrichota bacterium]